MHGVVAAADIAVGRDRRGIAMVAGDEGARRMPSRAQRLDHEQRIVAAGCRI